MNEATEIIRVAAKSKTPKDYYECVHDGTTLTISYHNRAICIDDAQVRLGKSCFAMLKLLTQNKEVMVTTDDFVHALYGNRRELPGLKVLQVFINRIRVTHPIFRTMLQTVWGRGYVWSVPCTDAMIRERGELEERARPPHILCQGNVITIADLPLVDDSVRWVVRRKAEVGFAVGRGLLTLPEACRRYRASEAEIKSWQKIKYYGL